MDIPFIRKKNNTGTWIAAGVAGTIVAGAAAFIYFTKRGFAFWNWNKNQEEQPHETPAYMQQHGLKRKQKTDPKDLESIIHHEE
jgi:predicted secreted acid phosphatase